MFKKPDQANEGDADDYPRHTGQKSKKKYIYSCLFLTNTVTAQSLCLWCAISVCLLHKGYMFTATAQSR